MEAEFVACFEATVHGLWLQNFISGLGIVDTITKPLKIYCDNSAAVFFSKNNRYSNGAKHMKLKYFAVKEEVHKQRVSIEHIATTLMIADPLTKGLLMSILNVLASARIICNKEFCKCEVYPTGNCVF
jgi:hypothetical protein